jgi:hypothetical protein
VLRGVPADMGPVVIALQEEGSLLLWPDSGNSRRQLSHRRDAAVTVDGLSGFQEIEES